MIKSTLKRLARTSTVSRTARQRCTVAVFLVAALMLPVTRIRAASSATSEAVCDVNADYALGEEDYQEAIRLHEEVLGTIPTMRSLTITLVTHTA